MRRTNRPNRRAERRATSGRGRSRGAWLSPVQRSPESPRPELLPSPGLAPAGSTPALGSRGHRRPSPGGGSGAAGQLSERPRWPVRPRPRPGPWLSPCPGPLSYPVLGLGPRPRPRPASQIGSSSRLGPSECPDRGPSSGAPSSP